MNHRILLSLVAAMSLTACGARNDARDAVKNDTSSTANGIETSLALVPRPSDPATELAQLQRHKGQTSFLSLSGWWGKGCANCDRQDQPNQEEAKQGGARVEQEADVYKVGEAGSKLLYLMNNYRGLQVVSFADGVDKPKLLGRAKGTGKTPDEMYFAPGQRLIVIEHEYNWSSQEERGQTNLLVYDVANPETPTLMQVVQPQGLLADSRIVGDVLYVASRKGMEGHVTSYSLSGRQLKEVDHQVLSLGVADRKNMAILNEDVGGKTNYYLVATLSENKWSWWDNSSAVEVVDITDPKGQIRPVMTVATKGLVRERSQTYIKNSTLVVTSNYGLGEGEIARIAVETFRLPPQAPDVLTADEAEYRRLHIQRSIQALSGRAKEEAQEKLLVDPQLGLRGRFVRAANGSLRKIINDSIVTVGDGSGLHANLRDVRVQDGLLYAFWVPQNEIDPFDLFDVSQPEKGVRYLSRLHFDGWIERAIPMTLGGRNFVLGLGWVVPVVNNESGRRAPQAMIFEIVNQSGKLRAVDVAQFSFEGSDIWADLNSEDKMIEVRQTHKGMGEILFGASRWGNGDYASGGQILKFDLNAIFRAEFDQALSKGDFINGGADWIRRVFTNPEIQRINSFSDMQLATFAPGTGNGSGDLHPISVLELARNIRSFAVLKDGAGEVGVQFIEGGDWRKSETELRTVNVMKADSEKHDAIASVKIPGSFVDQLIERTTGDLYVLTTRYNNVQRNDGSYDYRSISRVTRLKTSAGQLVVVGQTEFSSERTNSQPMVRKIQYGYHSMDGLIQLADGTLLAQAESSIRKLELNDVSNSSPFELANCTTSTNASYSLQLLGDQLVMSSSEEFKSVAYPGLNIERKFIARVDVSAGKGQCGPAVNAPGEPLLFTKSGELLVQDDWLEDVEKISYDETNFYYDVSTNRSLIALKIENATARLTDEEAQAETHAAIHRVSDSTFAKMTRENGQNPKLEIIGLSQDAEITRTSTRFQLDGDLGEETTLVHVAKNAAGDYYGLVRAGSAVQIIRWSALQARPSVVSVKQMNERYQFGDVSKVIRLPSAWGWSDQYFMSADMTKLAVTQGIYGITQVALVP